MSLRGLMVRSDVTMWTWCHAHVDVVAERTMLTTSLGIQLELVLKVDSALAYDYIKIYIYPFSKKLYIWNDHLNLWLNNQFLISMALLTLYPFLIILEGNIARVRLLNDKN